MHRRVKVLLYGQVVGELSQNDSGFLYQYAPDYHGPAISISLPVAQRQFPSEMLHPYFASLAPEGWLRQRYSQIQHRDENDLLGMLIDNGKNLLGAIQILPWEE